MRNGRQDNQAPFEPGNLNPGSIFHGFSKIFPIQLAVFNPGLDDLGNRARRLVTQCQGLRHIAILERIANSVHKIGRIDVGTVVV